MIQDALKLISNDCVVRIFVEKERINIEKVGDARREAKSVEPLTSDENNFVDCKISSCMEEDYHEERVISSNPNLSRVKTQMLIKILWIFTNVHQMKLYCLIHLMKMNLYLLLQVKLPYQYLLVMTCFAKS